MKISIATSAALVSSLVLTSSVVVSSLSVQQPQQVPSRRAWLASAGTSAALVLAAGMVMTDWAPPVEAAPLGASTPVGREKDAVMSLIDNCKNTDLSGGLDASTLKEDSIPFIEFCEKMKDDKVEFVEFIVPSGDVAYATIKGRKKPIRIGQGYPIDKPGSWSSPAFVIRSVSNFEVPYKFTVPGMPNFN